MIAFVALVTARSAASGSRLNVRGSTSAKTGVAPHCHTAFAVAMNDIEGTTTSSPGPTPETWSASWSAVVQLLTATASTAQTRSANAGAIPPTRGPGDPQPEAITSATARPSSPRRYGRANGTAITPP